MGIRLQVYAFDREPASAFLERPLCEVIWHLVECGSVEVRGNWLPEGFALSVGRGVLRRNGKERSWLDRAALANVLEFQSSALSYLQANSVYYLLFLLQDLVHCRDTPFVRSVIGSGHRRWWTASILEAMAERYTFYAEERKLIGRLFAKMCRDYGIMGGYEPSSDPGIAADAPIAIDDLDLQMNYFNAGEVTDLLTFLKLLMDEIPDYEFRCPEALANQNWEGWNAWVREMIANVRSVETFGFREPCLLSFIG